MVKLVLIHGPVVGADCWEPTADKLREAGAEVQVPDVLTAQGGMPAWRDWPKRVRELVRGDGPFVLVGHSAATPIIAAMVARMKVSGLIMTDGFIPPDSGPIAPAEGAFLELIKTLPIEDGAVPLWTDWWTTDEQWATIGIAEMKRDPVAFEAFESNQPRVAVDWFDDKLELEPWIHTPSAYIQTSSYFMYSAYAAEGRDWPVERLEGTHLHGALAPDEMAGAILKMSAALA